MSRLHVVFDLDDTLYPERQFALSGFKAAGAWAESELGLANLADDMTRLLDAGHLGRLFALVLEERLPGHHPDHVKGLISAYRNAEPDLTLFDDARWAVDHYAGRGPMGLITDGTLAMQRKKVQALALDQHFREIVYTDALGDARAYFKPHPMAFEVIERALGTAGDRYVYIGDNPAKDFIAPNARGWLTVQVVRDGGIHDNTRVVTGGEPQHRVTSLHELPDIIGA